MDVQYVSLRTCVFFSPEKMFDFVLVHFQSLLCLVPFCFCYRASNRRYIELCKSKPSNERFVESSMQTFKQRTQKWTHPDGRSGLGRNRLDFIYRCFQFSRICLNFVTSSKILSHMEWNGKWLFSFSIFSQAQWQQTETSVTLSTS